MAPSQNEIEEAKKFNVNIVMDEGKAVGIKKLISLISDAKYIVSNDTGPAHIASHLNKKGIVLFGEHTSAKKVSIGNSNFKVLSVKNLKDLSADTVMNKIKLNLN